MIGKGERACAEHRAEYERARGTRQARGYGAGHDELRQRWARVIAKQPVTCARCGEPIIPGMAFHLDHTDDRTGYLGPSHVGCNTAAGGRVRGGG